MIATPLPPELAEPLAGIDGDPAAPRPGRAPARALDRRHRAATRASRATRTPASERWTALLAARRRAVRHPRQHAAPGSSRRCAPRRTCAGSRPATPATGEQLGAALELDAGVLRDVTVTSVSGIHAGPLAEFALLGLLAFAKRLPELTRDKAARALAGRRRRRWACSRGGPSWSSGSGRSGSRSRAWRAPSACACSASSAPPRTASPASTRSGRPSGSPSWPHGPSDLVVTLPLTDATRGLVDAAALRALRPGAVVVNVGRGAVIDEAALVDGAARRPPRAARAWTSSRRSRCPLDSPLWALENVIVAPHAAARTDDEDARAVARVRRQPAPPRGGRAAAQRRRSRPPLLSPRASVRGARPRPFADTPPSVGRHTGHDPTHGRRDS